MYMATSVTTTHLSQNLPSPSGLPEKQNVFNEGVAVGSINHKHLHFSCPHCAKAYYTLETEFFSDEQLQKDLGALTTPTPQLFSCENCHKDFLVEWEEELRAPSAETVVSIAETEIATRSESHVLAESSEAIHKKDFVAKENLFRENSFKDNLNRNVASKEEKTFGVFLFETFKYSLRVKYLPFYLGLICFMLGLIFAHMRNAIGLAAVLMLLQMAFSYLFETKS